MKLFLCYIRTTWKKHRNMNGSKRKLSNLLLISNRWYPEFSLYIWNLKLNYKADCSHQPNKNEKLYPCLLSTFRCPVFLKTKIKDTLPFVLWWVCFYHLLHSPSLRVQAVLHNCSTHTDISVFRNFILIPGDLYIILEASSAK